MSATRKLRRSRRAVQMREAQRRRRQRLKDQRLSFLQIILPARLRDRLVTLSKATGVTLQEAALDILTNALAPEPASLDEAFRDGLDMGAGSSTGSVSSGSTPSLERSGPPFGSTSATFRPKAADQAASDPAQLDLF